MHGAMHHNTESGAPRTGRGRRISHTVLLCAMFATLLIGSVPSAANEIPWRDLPTAEANLAQATTDREATAIALAAVDDEIAATSSDLATFVAQGDDRVATIQSWREQSRHLSVEAYINGGREVTTGLFASQTTADLMYRSVLMTDQAEATLDAANTYAALIATTDDVIVDEVEGIDALLRRRDGLTLDLARAEQQLIDARWVVEIASIHALADEEFATNGRADPTFEQWDKLRHCESTNTYDVNTGNTFYGAYQFDYQTWFTVGGAPNTRADQAPPEEQDARARLLYSRRGSQPWPVCGRFLP